MNRISFLNRGYAFKGLLAVMYKGGPRGRVVIFHYRFFDHITAMFSVGSSPTRGT